MIVLIATITVVYIGYGCRLLFRARKESIQSANRLYTYIQSAMFFMAALLFSTILIYLATHHP
ncbi:hypothetical protein GCM10028803_30580 [Larkinella knui]|uniref:Uncharacterized protein n=1 Tax=Larkinella knui TaxID=2025310 RepID=A0A3P1CYL9_9BACT|nr:hypothetical protein [Larkinella knui]RRB18086.1 hypothetical protein EHT87_07375 [Larkinella knui]